jgi:Pectate lyase superfamily protein
MSTMDVTINNSYPGLIFIGEENPLTPHYFEEREYRGALYRTVNASFNKSTTSWSHYGPGAAYAVVQRQDGSVGFYTVPAGTSSWSSWNGFDDRGIYNVRDFGALANGSDDSAAISAASAAASAAGGGIVYMPPGNYSIQYRVVLYSFTVLMGAGINITTMTALSGVMNSTTDSTPTADMVTNYANTVTMSDPDYNISVRDITFNGNASENLGAFGGDGSTDGGATVHLQKVQKGAVVQGCRIYNCPNHGIAIDGGAIDVANVGPTRILDNIIDIMATRGTVGGQPNSLTSGNLSIRAQSMYNVFISGNILGYNPDPSLDWTTTWANDGIDTPDSSYVSITENQIQYVTDGIGVAGGDHYTIANNIVEHFLGYGIRSVGTADLPNGVSDITIVGNAVTAEPFVTGVRQLPSQTGIHVQATGLPTISPAAFFTVGNNSVVGPYEYACISFGANQGCCTGNAVDINHYALSGGTPAQVGILVSGSDATVTGNHIYDSAEVLKTGVQLYGIQFSVTGGSTQQQCITADSNVVNGGTDGGVHVTGIDIENDLYQSTVTNNNVAACQTPLNIATGATLVQVRICGNLGYTPAPSLTPAPSISSAQTNTFPFDCTAYIKNATTVTVNGQALGVTGTISVRIPVNSTIHVTGSGSQAWVWIPE